MKQRDRNTPSNLDNPARYRIRVHGHLGSRWSSHLGNLEIAQSYTKDDQPVSILTGTLLDQAALSGVLNTLHDLHTRLISVENLDESEGD